MCQRWFVLLIPLFIPAGTSTLDESAALAPSSDIEDIIPGNPDNINHQLFKRRFTGYKDFNKYKIAKSNGRIHTFFLRNPYATLGRSKRSDSGILRMLKTLFVNRSEKTEPEQTLLPITSGKAIRETENSEYASKERKAYNNNVLNRIERTLSRLDNELKAMTKEKENAYIMFEVPVPFVDYARKSRAKRETNEPNLDKYDEDSNITVIAKTKPNKQKTTTTPTPVSKIEEKVENKSTNTSVLTIARNRTDKNDSARITETALETNKTEEVNNDEKDNKTLTLAEFSDDSRKSYKPNDNDNFILKIEEILDDIHIKLSPLKRIKETHSKDEEYKVGYIIASLETAQETIEKLLNKLKKRESLPKDQTQDILDKVTLSSMVVSNLMNFLGRYSNPPETHITPANIVN